MDTIQLIVWGVVTPLLVIAGHWLGGYEARMKYRREIDHGREYLIALEEARLSCLGPSRLEIGILVTREAIPAARGEVHLRTEIVEGPEQGGSDA